MQKVLLCFLTVAALWGVWSACESDYTSPSYTCTGYTMDLTMQDSTGTSLNVNNNTLFRTLTDTGNYKLLALETLVDSVKIIFNLMDGPLNGDVLWTDSLPLKTYRYSRHGGQAAEGLVIAGVKSGNAIQYYETDTSCVTLTKWDIGARTMSGVYYFEANNHTVKGHGTFNNVCFISLK